MDFQTPYWDMFISDHFRKSSYNAKKDVIHRATCPKCAKKLVNLYPSNEDKKIYICKECKGGINNGRK